MLDVELSGALTEECVERYNIAERSWTEDYLRGRSLTSRLGVVSRKP